MSGELQFDAIVVGSGITGGWAAKELTERGFRVLLIERGRHIEHQTDYETEMVPPWELPFRGYGDPQLWKEQYPVQSEGRYFDEWTYKHFVNDRDHPYEMDETRPFLWKRSYQLGGKSLVWGRQTYRWSPQDFEANAKDGHGVDWPIRYDDLAPWYDHVEKFIGVQGAHEGLDVLPDGQFLGQFDLTAPEIAFRDRLKKAYSGRRTLTVARSAHLTAEKEGRGKCQFRMICARGCSYGAYFSTQSATLPAAQKTGRLTLITDSVVESLQYDPATRKISGVRVLDIRSKKKTVYSSRVVFLCASTIDTIGVMFRSASAEMPNGLGNSSGVLGHYFMDHVAGAGASAMAPEFAAHTTFGNRPTPFIVPRFRNVAEKDTNFDRGYVFFGSATQRSWRSAETAPGIGAEAKTMRHAPGSWGIGINILGEALPRSENRVLLAKNGVDRDGLPQMRIEYSHGENEKKMLADAEREAKAMVGLMGPLVYSSGKAAPGGSTVHEMGGARMGKDPRTSVLNGRNQAHDIANLFITDGACMSSSASVNPSLTYMALTARACAAAEDLMKAGAL